MAALVISAVFTLVASVLLLLELTNQMALLSRCRDSISLALSFLFNAHRLHDLFAEILEKNNGTVLLRCKFLLDYDMLLTSDPSNVNHVTATTFSSYEKGEAWRKEFDVFGESAFNADFEIWENDRKIIRAFMNDTKFHRITPKIVNDHIVEELMPFLEQAADQACVVDLQDMFQRLFFDITFLLVSGNESRSLGFGRARPEFLDGINDAVEGVFNRFILPETIWKLQKWFRIGKEKKIISATEAFDRAYRDFIKTKQDKTKTRTREEPEITCFNVMNCFIRGPETSPQSPNSNDKLRDLLSSLMLAGEDTVATTLTWFFWLLSRSPDSKRKVEEEISNVLGELSSESRNALKPKDLNKLLYLHACLSETLRLYPAVPAEMRMPRRKDKLPTGHEVDRDTKVVISTYSMGRTKSIWGPDCSEFNPQRWISEDGEKIKYEPPYKFYAFNAGPRICPGKSFAFTMMKMVVVAILRRFDFQVVANHPVVYKPCLVLHMKHGLKAMVSRKPT